MNYSSTTLKSTSPKLYGSAGVLLFSAASNAFSQFPFVKDQHSKSQSAEPSSLKPESANLCVASLWLGESLF